MSSPQIFPSLLSANAGSFQAEIDRMDPFTDGIHFDVMDGHFVPNITFGSPVLKHLQTKNFFDVHLMIENADQYIENFVEAGAAMISVHGENNPHVHRTLQLIKSFGVKAGIAINPATSFETAKEWIRFADFVLVMSVNPGFGGQTFIPETLDKIRTIRSHFPDTPIEVDGGVNSKTASAIVEAGATILVSGSYLFGAEDLAHAVAQLKYHSNFSS